MTKTIRARVRAGVLEPIDKIDLPEGKEVMVTIVGASGGSDAETFSRSAGGWRGLVDAEELIRNIYEDRLTSTRPEPKL
jgi:predicted DNA-binding antitoxin AbrB/MazE fold protein